MAAQKPIPYPNLHDSITSVVDAYEAVHAAVSTHAEEHRKTLEERRRALAVKKAAAELLKGEAS